MFVTRAAGSPSPEKVDQMDHGLAIPIAPVVHPGQTFRSLSLASAPIFRVVEPRYPRQPSSRASSPASTVNADYFERPSVFDRLGHSRNTYDPTPCVDVPTYPPTTPAYYLPAVTTKMREKLAKIDEFIDLGELLRLPGQPGGATNFRIDPDNPDSVLVVPALKKEQITSFATWMRAFYIFAAHRSSHHPHLKEPLFKYAAVIATLADPVHGYTIREWLAYDVRFRLHMCVHHSDFARWTQINEQVWRESRILARDNTYVPASAPAEQLRAGTSYGCNICGQQHHQWRACPLRYPDPRNRAPGSFSMPFLGRPAQEGRTPLCHNFNEGNCASPCRWGRVHQCTVCNASTHGKFNHPRGRIFGVEICRSIPLSPTR